MVVSVAVARDTGEYPKGNSLVRALLLQAAVLGVRQEVEAEEAAARQGLLAEEEGAAVAAA